jgi:hypothetical protein
MLDILVETEVAADKGARLLDAVMPTWHRHIDIDNLDIASLEWCILVQLFGGFSDGLATVFPAMQSESGLTPPDLVSGYGFDGHDMTEARALTDAWVSEVVQRNERF